MINSVWMDVACVSRSFTCRKRPEIAPREPAFLMSSLICRLVLVICERNVRRFFLASTASTKGSSNSSIKTSTALAPPTVPGMVKKVEGLIRFQNGRWDVTCLSLHVYETNGMSWRLQSDEVCVYRKSLTEDDLNAAQQWDLLVQIQLDGRWLESCSVVRSVWAEIDKMYEEMSLWRDCWVSNSEI